MADRKITELNAATSTDWENDNSLLHLVNPARTAAADRNTKMTIAQAKAVFLPDNGVTAIKLGTGAVTETKLGTGAVTNTKLGTGAVTTAKLGATTFGAASAVGVSAGASYVLPENAYVLWTNNASFLLEVQIATGNWVGRGLSDLSPAFMFSDGTNVRVRNSGGTFQEYYEIIVSVAG